MVVKPPKPKDPDSSMPGMPSIPSLPSMPTPSIPSTSTGIYKNKHPPINLNPPIPPIKKIEDKTKVNVRYPLISPYAYAHIYWNAKSSELVYDIEEPILNEQEKKLLRIIKNALQEIINISYLGEQSQEQILEYIAKAINLIAEELSLKIPESTYNKIFYYVYRDFIGLNEIEPLMRDYFIEDIECNGINSSVYVVHRLYRNIRTNLIFYSIDYLASLVEKLAQRCGKYISYANPLLDGTLPDGSRVNATYTTEITTRGPTFCFKDGYVQLNDGRVKNIKELFEEAKKNFPTKIEGGNEIVEVANVGCCGVDEKSLEQVDARIKSIIKLKPPEKLVKISFSDGGEIEVTLNHLFHVADDCLKLIEAKDLKPGMFVPMPKKINVRGYRQKIDVYSLIKDFSYFKKVCVVANPSIKQLIASIISQTGNYRQVLAQRYGVGSSYFYEIISRGNSIAFEILDRICVERNVDFSSFDEIAIVVYGGGTKNKAKAIKVPKEVDEDLGYLAGALISDGHLSKDFVDFCCYEEGFGEAVKERLLRKFGKFDSYYNGKRIYLCNSFVPFFFNRVFGIPIGKKTTIVKVPEVIFKSDDKVIASFIRGLFDGDGICHSGLSYKTYSKELAEGLTYLLARLGIYSYLRNRGKEYTVNIPSPYYAKYLELIGFNNKAKEAKLKSLVEKQNASRIFRKHDRIPAKPLLNIIKKLGLSKYKLLKECGFSCDKLDYLSISRHFASKLLHKILKNKNAHKAKDDIEYVNWLINSEQEFVRIDKVEIVENSEAVYDIELEPCRFFVAGNKPMNMFDTIRKFTKIPWSPTQLIGFKTVSPEMLAYFWLLLQYKANILITGGTGSGKTSMLNALAFFIPPEARVVSIEDTREINLPRENWLPSVARTGLGGAEEIDLFTLLRESFRQRPDYVIVGEVRGREAYVLFQGMASGHASLSTIHADSVDAVIKRLQTPPISLSPTLLNILDVIAIMQHATVKGQETRRLAKVVEIVNIAEDGTATVNVPFYWSPAEDKFYTKKEIYVFNKISERYGLSKEYLMNEFRLRTQLLFSLYKKGITDFFKVQKIINQYYKTPAQVIKEYL
jgi:type IV secretory pathway ATPase VirB11/archaellum biosynthesis ATPase/intein/homing endonuclease